MLLVADVACCCLFLLLACWWPFRYFNVSVSSVAVAAVTTVLFSLTFKFVHRSRVGKRMCLWLQDFAFDFSEVARLAEQMPLLGVKGTTGTLYPSVTLSVRSSLSACFWSCRFAADCNAATNRHTGVLSRTFWR